MRTRIARYLLVAAVALSTAMYATAARQESAPAYPHRIEMVARSGERVVLDYEIISDYEEGIFHRPIGIEIGKDGRQYYLDEGDQDIKVFNANNEFLFSFGGRGQGPGEWGRTTLFTISPDNRVYVWDDLLNVFHVFTAEGQYVHRVRHPGARIVFQSFAWIGPSELVGSGLSMAPSYYRFVAHRFRIEPEGDQFTLVKEDSFLKTREMAPGVYMLLESGFLTSDVDGDLLFSATRRHEIAKYTTHGAMLWKLSDEEIMPDAAKLLEATEYGRVRIGPGAGRSGGTVSVGNWIVHSLFVETIGLPARPRPDRSSEAGYVDTTVGVDWSKVRIRKVLELIDRQDPEGHRLVVDTMEDFWLRTTDRQGRVYGVLNMLDPLPIRGRFLVDARRP